MVRPKVGRSLGMIPERSVGIALLSSHFGCPISTLCLSMDFGNSAVSKTNLSPHGNSDTWKLECLPKQAQLAEGNLTYRSASYLRTKSKRVKIEDDETLNTGRYAFEVKGDQKGTHIYRRQWTTTRVSYYFDVFVLYSTAIEGIASRFYRYNRIPYSMPLLILVLSTTHILPNTCTYSGSTYRSNITILFSLPVYRYIVNTAQIHT